MSEIDNNVAVLATDPHNLGEFKTVYDAMRKYPNGGVAGDYITILGVQHFWNINRASWGILKDKEDNIVQMVEDFINYIKEAGWIYAGIARPDTKPKERMDTFYFAYLEGVYLHFDNIQLNGYEISILRKTKEGWIKEDTGAVSVKLKEYLEQEVGDLNTSLGDFREEVTKVIEKIDGQIRDIESRITRIVVGSIEERDALPEELLKAGNEVYVKDLKVSFVVVGNGEFSPVSGVIVQQPGANENAIMSQKACTEAFVSQTTLKPISEEEYKTLKESGQVDDSIFYFIYEEE